MPVPKSLVVVFMTTLAVLPPAAAPSHGQTTASLQYPAAPGAVGAERGASDPAFHTPSRPPGVDYTLPRETDIVAVLGRIRDHFVRTTPYQVIDTVTGARITDLTQPAAAAGIDTRPGEYNEWTYSMGVVLAGMLHASEATGDASFAAYTRRNFDFILDHLAYFRRQAEAFGAPPRSLRRLIDGQIEGIVVGTTAAYDAVYYYNRPTALGAMQGYGPALLAGAEVLTMLRQFDIGRSLNTYHYSRRTSQP